MAEDIVLPKGAQLIDSKPDTGIQLPKGATLLESKPVQDNITIPTKSVETPSYVPKVSENGDPLMDYITGDKNPMNQFLNVATKLFGSGNTSNADKSEVEQIFQNQNARLKGNLEHVNDPMVGKIAIVPNTSNTPSAKEYSDKVYKLMENNIKTIQPNIDSFSLHQATEDGLKKIGFEPKVVLDENNIPNTVWQKNQNFTPNVDEIEAFKKQSFDAFQNNKKEADAAYTSLQNLQDPYYLERAKQAIPFGIGNFFRNSDDLNSIKSTQDFFENAQKQQKENSDGIQQLFTEAKLQNRNTANQIDPETNTKPWDYLSAANDNQLNHEQTVALANHSTQLINNSIPKTPEEETNYFNNLINIGIEENYYTNPNKESVKKINYGSYNPDLKDGKIEQEQLLYNGINSEKQIEYDNIKSYQDVLDNTINPQLEKAQIKAKETGSVEDLKKLKELADLKLATEANIEAKNKHIKYLQNVENTKLTNYKQFQEEQAKSDRVADLSPYSTALITASRDFVKKISSDPAHWLVDKLKPLQAGLNEEQLSEATDLQETPSLDKNMRDFLTKDRKSFITPNLLDESTGQRTAVEQLKSLEIVDKDGNFKLSYSVPGMIYQSTKTSAESFTLGLVMMGGFGATEWGFAKALGKLAPAAEEGAAIGEVTGLENESFKLGLRDILHGAAQTPFKVPSPTSLLTGKLTETSLQDIAAYSLGGYVGSVVPSQLLYGDEMMRQQMEKGLTFEQAKDVGNTMAAVEGYSELFFLNELKFTKSLIGGGEIKTLEHLTENEAYQHAIESTFGKSFFSKYKKYVTNTLNFAKEAALVGLEEGAEEVEGNIHNHLWSLQKAKGYKYDYQTDPDDELTIANQVNTMVSTMATMLPMMGQAGYHGVHEYLANTKVAQYQVGQNPSVYIETVNQLLKNNAITKDEALRRTNLISKYAGYAQEVNTLVANTFTQGKNDKGENDNSKNTYFHELPKDQQERYKQTVYNQLLSTKVLQEAVTSAPTDADKMKIVELYDKETIKLSQLLEQGAFKNEDERVANISGNLEYFINPTTLKTSNDISSLDNTIKNLVESASKEKNDLLKTKYLEKIAQLNTRKEELLTKKTEAEKPEPQKADENNQKGTITIQKDDGKPFNLLLNTPYYLSSIESKSVDGHKIITNPEFQVISDNGDGSVTISSDGEVSTMDKADLGKYNFTQKSTVDTWRKPDANGKVDVKALIFDNRNDVFTYSFAKETSDRVKEPKGRIIFDTVTNTAKFVYKDKKGNTREQVINSNDFTKQGNKESKLKRIRTLETQGEFDARQAKYEEEVKNTDLAKLDAQKANRLAVLHAFIKQEGEKLTKLHDKDITKLNKKLDKLRVLVADIKNVAKITNTKLSAKDAKKYLKGTALEELLSGNTPPTKYAITRALLDKVNELKQDVSGIETQISNIEQAKSAILEQLGLEYEDVLNADYDSDVSLTKQIKEYRDNLKKQFDLNTSILDRLKQIISDTKDALTDLAANITGLIPSFQAIAYDPTKEQEDDIADIDLQEYLKQSEKRFEQISKENEQLSPEIDKLTKLINFLKKEEKKFDEQKQKLQVQKVKDQIYKSQEVAQTSSETDNPATDLEKSKDLQESSKIDLRQLFNSLTQKEEKNEKGEITNPYIRRYQNFLNRVTNLTAHKLLFITKDNAAQYGLSGIIFSDDKTTNKTDKESDNDIKAVVIKQGEDGKITFVDQDGKDLEKPTKDNIVYSSVRKATLNWSDGSINYHLNTGDLTSESEEKIKAFAESLRQNHEEYRQAIIDYNKTNEIPFTLPITGVSRGFENQTDPAPKSVIGNLLPKNVDLGKTLVIQLPKTDKSGSLTGQVAFQGNGQLINMPIGRPLLSWANVLAFLNNRKFSTKEAGKFARIFQYLYTEAVKTGKLDANVVNYLAKVIYWRNPDYKSPITNTTQDKNTIGKNQVWYDGKDNTIHIGNNGFKISFAFAANDEENVAAIEAFFNGDFNNDKSVFHNVDALGLLEPFAEIVDIKAGKPLVRNWSSYQEYLLSDKYPDGTDRDVNDIPLTTNVNPSTENAPNISGRYITYENKSNDSVVDNNKQLITSDGKTQVVTTVPSSTTPVNTGFGEWNATDNKFGNLAPSDNIQYKAEFTNAQGIKREIVFRVTDSKKAFVISHNYGDTTPVKAIVDSISDLIQGKEQGKGWNISSRTKEEVKPTIPIADEDAKNLVANTFSNFKKSAEQPSGNTPPQKDEVVEENQKAALDFLKHFGGNKSSDTNYRLAIPNKSYKLENLEAAKKWFEERFPKIDFSIVTGLIDGKAWGKLENAAIKLSDLAEEGTVYHEAFETVHRYFLNKRQLAGLRKEFRNRKGTFIDRETGETIEYFKATNHQIKEQLAEEYRDYELSGGKSIFKGEINRNGLFRRIYDFIHDLVFNVNSIKEVFDKISDAKYKDSIPNLNLQDIQSSYRIEEIKKQNPIFFNDVMKSMTNLLFESLRKQNKAIPEIFKDNYNINAEHDRVKSEIDNFYGTPKFLELIKDFDKQSFIDFFSKSQNAAALGVLPVSTNLKQFAIDNKLTIQSTLEKLYDVLNNYKYINDNWKELTQAHKLFLSKYQIEFEEQEENDLVKYDEDSNQGDIYDAIKLNRKYNANSEVKLLIATLREQEYVNTVVNEKLGITKQETKPKLNTLLMSNLVDYNKTINSLLHKLTDTTNFDEVSDIIKSEALKNASLLPLVDKLKLNEKNTLALSAYDVDLRNKFYTSLSNMEAEYEKLSIEPGTLTGNVINLNEANALRLVKDMWLSALIPNKKITTSIIEGEKDAVKYLKELGFEFPDIARFKSEERIKFLEAVRDLNRLIAKNSKEILLYDNAQTRQQLNTLANLYVKYSDNYSEPQHLNIEGEAVQNIMMHNSIGINIKDFNSANTLDQLFEKAPYLNPTNDGNSYLNFSQLFKKGGKFFNFDGKRRNSLSLEIVDGSEVKSTQGTSSSNLSITDRIAQEFAMNLEGIFYILTPADAKTEWAIKFGNFVTTQEAKNKTFVLDQFKDYLKAEILAIQQFQKEGSNLLQFNKDIDGSSVGEQLRHFKKILKGIDLNITTNKTPEQIIKAKEALIDKAILDYISNYNDRVFKNLTDNRVIRPYVAEEESSSKTKAFIPEELQKQEVEPLYSIAFAPKTLIKEGLTETEVKDIINANNINYIYSIIEQHKLLWGDPAQWKDITKRTKSYTSPRMLSVANAQYFNEWHNKYSNQISFLDKDGNEQTIQLEQGDIGFDVYDDNIRTQTFLDVDNVVSDNFNQVIHILLNQKSQDYFNKDYKSLKEEEKAKIDKLAHQGDFYKYEEINEADAQAIAFPNGYKQIRQRANTWGEAEEEQKQWDDALFRLDNNFYPEGSRGDLLRQHDEILKDRGNPYLLRAANNQTLPVMNILKPIYAGYKEGEKAVNVLDKMSIAPTSWRTAKGTNMEKWYTEHYKANTTYITMESARKVGAIKGMQSLYNEDGITNNNVNHELLNYSGFGIQVETKTQKDKSTLGTQLTKQATINLLSGGIPTDYRGNREQWNNLSEQEKQNTSEHYRLTVNNNNILSGLKELSKKEIFKEFGVKIVKTEKGNSYSFENVDKLEALIQRELNNRDATENVKDYAKINPKTGEFYLPFDLLIGGEKVEYLITSIIDKNILRPKMFGGQMPQVASTLFEKEKRNLAYKDSEGNWNKVEDISKLSETERKTVKFTSNELKFYTLSENGKKVEGCEVMLPFYYKEYIAKGVELNINDIPEELRRGIGFRIPTQGLNSIENFTIKGFLPVEYGNSIVVPSEITTKAGSDFDIDKLNIYLHNYYIDQDTNKPVKVKYLDNTNSTAEQRYEKLKKEQKFYEFLKTKEGYEYYKAATDLTSTNLISTIFNEDLSENKLDLTKSYDENLELAKISADNENNELPSLEEFKNLPIEQQNTKKALENQYIDNLINIMELPSNFAQLVEPNSAKVLQDNAKDINKLYQKEEIDNDMSKYLDRLNNAETRYKYLQGKGAVGIGASSLSQHGLSQVVGLQFELPYKTTLDKVFNFATNSTIKEGNIFYSLSEALAKDGRAISSTISSFLNAFVDIAKDPFIFDINGNYTTAGYYITGVRLGMPINSLVRWFNQPIIREYIAELEKNKSILTKASDQEKYPSEILNELANKYGFKFGETTERAEDYSDSELEGYIKEWVEEQKKNNPKYSQNFINQQGNLLYEFTKLTDLSWELFRFGQAISYDTTRTTSFDSIRIKFAKTLVGMQGKFAPYIQDILDKTFIGNIVRAKFELLQSVRRFYITESPQARVVLNPILNSFFNSKLSGEVIEEAAKNMRRQFITYVLHTTPISINNGPKVLLTSYIEDLFKGDNNIANRTKSLQAALNSGKIDDNFFAKNLLGVSPQVLKGADIANIRFLRKSGDKFDNDLTTADFLNLKDNPKTREIFYDYIKTALLQNGVVPSYNSFTESIPNEEFLKLANQAFDVFKNTDISEQLSNFTDSYYENNWKDRNIVPYTKAKTAAGKSRLTGKWLEGSGVTFLQYYVDSNSESSIGFKMSKEAKNKYLLTVSKKLDVDGTPLYSKRMEEEMRKKGDFSFQEQTLWKRLEILNPNTGEMDSPLAKNSNKYGDIFYVLYYPVNKKGDGNNLIEHYSKASKSKIYDGFPIYSSQKIVDALDQMGKKSDLFLNQHYVITKNSLSSNLDRDEEGNLEEGKNMIEIASLIYPNQNINTENVEAKIEDYKPFASVDNIKAYDHAQDEETSEGIINGQKPTDLTEKGKQEALELGKMLKEQGTTELVISPIERAQQTAEIIKAAFDIPFRISENLATWDLGSLENNTPESQFDETPWTTLEKENESPNIEAEPFKEFRDRALLAWNEAKELPKGVNILTHSKLIAMFKAFNQTNGEWNEEARQIYLERDKDKIELNSSEEFGEDPLKQC